MRHLRHFYVLVFCLSLFASNFVVANDDFNGEELSTLLEIREEDRYLVYGEYAEVEITSKKSVDLNFYNETIPFGMELEKVSDTSFLIFGRAEFLGKLCFLLEATKNNGNDSVERLCLYSDENEELNYPNIITKRSLNPIKVSEYSTVDIEIQAGDVGVDSYVVSGLPAGLSESSNGSNLVLNGTVSEQGVYEIVVKATESNSEVASYKQFVLEVLPEENTYQCAPGYYYDDYLGYCVQASGRTCGEGTFYDLDTNSCVAYRTPGHLTCRPGRYYDHWLNRCVRINANRCPLNYEWDGYYNRCIRLPYTCSYGERYSYRRGICVSIFNHRACRIGTHWNTYRQRCVRNIRACYRGDYWSGGRCVRTVRTCRVGRYFDPYSRRCIRRHVNRYCGPGSVWNHRRATCVRRGVLVNRTCRPGTRWSGRNGRCIGHDDRRINRHPRRRHRPGPVTRPHRPRPNRPTTRPDRPNRPNRPTTRPDRPNRPNRPTTRPDRPNRPNRPTTRPDRPNRPNRPTTRPNRPNRGNGGGGTARPNRGNGGDRNRGNGNGNRRNRRRGN